MIKTNYGHFQLEGCFWSEVYEINYTTIKKQKKNI